MSSVQVLSLVLAFSVAAHIAVGTGLVARRAGAGAPSAILSGAGAAATALGLYLAAVAAYHG